MDQNNDFVNSFDQNKVDYIARDVCKCDGGQEIYVTSDVTGNLIRVNSLKDGKLSISKSTSAGGDTFKVNKLVTIVSTTSADNRDTSNVDNDVNDEINDDIERQNIDDDSLVCGDVKLIKPASSKNPSHGKLHIDIPARSLVQYSFVKSESQDTNDNSENILQDDTNATTTTITSATIIPCTSIISNSNSINATTTTSATTNNTSHIMTTISTTTTTTTTTTKEEEEEEEEENENRLNSGNIATLPITITPFPPPKSILKLTPPIHHSSDSPLAGTTSSSISNSKALPSAPRVTIAEHRNLSHAHISDYILEAGHHLHVAGKAEQTGDYSTAHNYTRTAITVLLRGVQGW